MRAAIVAIALLLAACGECVFEFPVEARVLDQDGLPVDGALVMACRGDRCDVGDDDDACVEATVDDAGFFALEVPQCRPAPFQCGLRPLVVTAAGCETAIFDAVSGAEHTLTCE